MSSIQFRVSHRGRTVSRKAPFYDRGERSKPIVVLVHGQGGEARDWSDPGYMKYNFDYEGSVPPDKSYGWHAFPPVGLPSVPPKLDGFKKVTGFEPFLRMRGFRTVNYDQVDSTGPIGDSALELEALIDALLVHLGTTSDARLALLAHSRGGLVVRKYLKDNAGSEAVSKISKVITLHSPNQGSYLANLSVLAGVGLNVFVAGLAPVPGFGNILKQLYARMAQGLSAESKVDLQVDSLFLRRLAANEAALPGISYHTFGGTSVTLTRVFQYLYTPDSWVPRPHLPPFKHRAEAAQWPIISPIAETFPAPCDELRHRRGDGLVSDVRARLPFAVHHTNHLNHAEALWDAQIKAQVASILD